MAVPYGIEFLKGLDEGVFVVNRDRQITLWNASAASLTGRDESEMIGKTCSRHLKCHVDQDGEPLCDDDCPLKKALSSGKQQEMKALMRHANGGLINVQIKVVPYHNQQGFVEGAIELFSTLEDPSWLKDQEALAKKVTFTDIETGMLNRHFLDTYYLGLLKSEHASFERGLVLIDVDMLSQFNRLNDKMKAFEIRQRIRDLLLKLSENDSEMVAARWSKESFVVLINNSHSQHLQDVVIALEKALRQALFNQESPSIDLCFRLMSTMISSDEPLEKVVDILHKRSAKTYRKQANL